MKYLFTIFALIFSAGSHAADFYKIAHLEDAAIFPACPGAIQVQIIQGRCQPNIMACKGVAQGCIVNTTINKVAAVCNPGPANTIYNYCD